MRELQKYKIGPPCVVRKGLPFSVFSHSEWRGGLLRDNDMFPALEIEKLLHTTFTTSPKTVQVFKSDSILKGFGLRVLSSCWDVAVKSTPDSVTAAGNTSPPLFKFSDSAPESPTTSMSLSLSKPSQPRWLRYSRFRDTKSTAMPLARSFRAWRSRAFCSFFRRRARSRARSSAGGIGSPEQDWGWALWAGRPGPFFVCSFLRHLARLFWNQT